MSGLSPHGRDSVVSNDDIHDLDLDINYMRTCTLTCKEKFVIRRTVSYIYIHIVISCHGLPKRDGSNMPSPFVVVSPDADIHSNRTQGAYSSPGIKIK